MPVVVSDRSARRATLVARLAAVVLLVLAGFVALPAASSQAASCSGTSGVTVVVQYSGPAQIRCAPGSPGSALAALTGAGFSATPTADMSMGYFLCKIDGQPSNQTCQRTPPANAYWAVFSARRGGSWSYLQEGVATFHPAAGSVVGFRFGAGAAPSVAPPAAAAPPPTTRPAGTPTHPRVSGTSRARPPTSTATSRSAQTAPAARSGSTSSSPTAGASSSKAAAPQSSSPTSTPRSSPSSTATTSSDPTSSGSSSTAVAAAIPSPAAPSSSGGPSWTGPALGGVLVVLLGGAAVAVARRRRTP